jgi:hypothetical protein
VLLQLTSTQYRDVSIFSGNVCHLHLRCESRRAIAGANFACTGATGKGTADAVEIAGTASGFAIRNTDYRRFG